MDINLPAMCNAPFDAACLGALGLPGISFSPSILFFQYFKQVFYCVSLELLWKNKVLVEWKLLREPVSRA